MTKNKKSFEKDLNHKRGLFFAIALVLVLALIYALLEWKFIDAHDGYDIEAEKHQKKQHQDSTITLETKAKKKHQP